MKKKMMSFICVISIILTLIMGVGVNAQETDIELEKPWEILESETVELLSDNVSKSDDIVVLYTNDVHTYIDKGLSYDTVAGIKAELQEQYEHVILVDAGDHVQGTAYGAMDKGKSIVEMMNAAGYDAATLGNHEFDYGMEGRIAITDTWSTFSYISCNFYNMSNGTRLDNVLDSYIMFDFGDEKIAVVGITTPESFTTSTPKYFQDAQGNYIYGIAGGADGSELYADVQTAVDAAVNAGATYVVALGHLGVDTSSGVWTSKSTIANVSGLDAFIDGHSHTTIESEMVKDKDGEDVVLTQTGEYFNAIGMMVIDSETGEITTTLLDEESEIVSVATKDATVTALKQECIYQVDSALNVKIGSLEVTLDNYDEHGNRIVRTQETNTGSFSADALYYLFDNMGMDVDVAIMNGGGVRNTALTGDITYKACKEIHTFGNVACLQTITGQQLLDALEWGARQTPDVEIGGFLHVAGITYDIDCSIESTVQSENGIWTGAPTGEYRVKNVNVYNKEAGIYEPLDVNASYNLAGYNYTLRDLGDGFTMFAGAVNVLDYVMEDYLVLVNYIQAFDDARVSAVNSPLNKKYSGLSIDYGKVGGSGRINLVNKSTSEDEWDGKINIGGLTNDIWFTKYGNVYTDCKAEDFVNKLGYTWGDMVTVKFLDKELTLPVVPDYSYVDSGVAAVIIKKNENDLPTGYVSLAINMGNFGETYGLGLKQTDADGNWYWEAGANVSYPVEVTVTLAEKEGYLAEYLLRQLVRTNNREDYPQLGDWSFANFREIAFGDVASKRLYRSSSPINPEIGRNTYADAALEEVGVTVIMNLADSSEVAKGYPDFEESYYSEQKVIYLNLGVDFAAEDFKSGLAKGLRFFANNKGVYAVHCTEGKDRAGFVSALLECLCGASYEDVVTDYMQTYINYYGVEQGTQKYDTIVKSNITKSLMSAFGVEDLAEADLSKEAQDYISSLGLSLEEINMLKNNLCNNIEETESETTESIPESEEKPPVTSPETGDSMKEQWVLSVLLLSMMISGAVLGLKLRKNK